MSTRKRAAAAPGATGLVVAGLTVITSAPDSGQPPVR